MIYKQIINFFFLINFIIKKNQKLKFYLAKILNNNKNKSNLI